MMLNTPPANTESTQVGVVPLSYVIDAEMNSDLPKSFFSSTPFPAENMVRELNVLRASISANSPTIPSVGVKNSSVVPSYL